MKSQIIILIVAILITQSIFAQDSRYKDKDQESPIGKTEGIIDRAGGLHNASQIGLFFENRGKLYPRRISQGPSGEWPINSGRHYIYRINPYVGIPGNVIQGRFTNNEEWEAVGGYHNREYSRIAMSDDPKTWHPINGWPVKDANGNPIIKSDQDSYCVYSDSNNSVSVLGIQISQTGYAYGISFAKDLLFFKYDIINTSQNTYDKLYFALYCDIDIGNISGGDPEYGDDFIGFDKDKNFLYFYDDGISNEWPPDKKTGHFGCAFLKTPTDEFGNELGVTDMHYNLYYDDPELDSIQYGLMSSSQKLYNSSIGYKYFHIGSNPTINFDDPTTIPAGGLDIVGTMSSGPYTLGPNDTLTFYTVIVAGNNKTEIMKNYESAKKIMDFNFDISKPPATPTLSGIAGDGKNILFWDDKAEASIDNFSGAKDFAGYRIYKSIDKGINWTQLADYNISSTSGLQYSLIDSNVINGFEYWYSVTSYDRGDSSIASLECSKGTNTNAINLISLTPTSSAIGYVPVSAGEVYHIGNGLSNYILNVQPIDNDSLASNYYTVGFTYVPRVEEGKLNTQVQFIFTDSTKTTMDDYAFAWLANNSVEIINLTTQTVLEPTPKYYRSGLTYTLNSGLRVKLTDPVPLDPEFAPKKGDFLALRFGTWAVRGSNDTVIAPRPIVVDQLQSTSDGVIFSLKKPDIIQNVSRIGGTIYFDLTFSVENESNVQSLIYLISVISNSTDASGKPFISLKITDDALNNIAQFDTLYNLNSFVFNGIRGRVQFNENNPPAAGNIYSLKTLKPIKPNVKDLFQFNILGSKINYSIIKDDLSNVKVVPNPYIVSSLYEPEYGELRREPLRQIQFINLPNECTILIYTVDADLIKTIHHNAQHGTEIWDLRTDGGRELAPGIYIYVIQAQGSQYKSCFAIIK